MSNASVSGRFPLAQCVHSQGNIVPRQRHTPPKLQRACDYREQWCLKHTAHRSEFHSFEEFLHAGLLEANPRVTCFVPQPFLVRLLGKFYTPDVYVEENGKRRVIEIKPRGEFDEAKRKALVAFCALHGMTFDVISNEDIRARQNEALHWMVIVRTLRSARDLNTDRQALEVLETLRSHNGSARFSVFVDAGDREQSYLTEIALLQLLHRGIVTADLSTAPLDYDTDIVLCT